MVKLALIPPQNKTIVVTLNLDKDGDVRILFNGITVAYICSYDGHIYKYGFNNVERDQLKALGVQLDTNGLIVFDM